jgi:FlaG/FlaF family flagellin (archaellin)
MALRRWLSASCMVTALAFTAPLAIPQIAAQTEETNKSAKKVTKDADKTSKKAAKQTGAPAKDNGTPSVDQTKANTKAGDKDPATGRPKGSTGLCGDGSYTYAAARGTACEGHGGIKSWYYDKDLNQKGLGD